MTRDEEAVRSLYQTMYAAMIAKALKTLEQIHAAEFVLTHMTGMKQSKQAYIDSIMNGTLNYYRHNDDEITVQLQGDKVRMRGRSRVEAAVFGGGRHTWRLQLDFDLARRESRWQLTACTASTY